MMENKHTIYFNMCHHYRKIFNAKPTIDTSPPKAFQIKSNKQWSCSRNPSPFRTKTPMQENVKTFQKEPYLTQDNGTVTCKYYYQHHNKKEDGTKNADKSCIKTSKPHNPRILKTTAQSKLRNLRVYHPPRRKKVVKSAETPPSSPQNGEDSKDEIIRRPVFADKTSLKSSKRQSLAVMDHNSYSEESSEDSAYNEGEGVLSSDSRGSTPQNLTNKHQSVKLSITDSNQHKIISTSMNKVNDEIVYIQFLKDITNDILKKNIFTNKALKSVFQHHLQINKYELEMEKMQKEITKLQDRLGVPKDDKLDDENYGLCKDSSISEPLKPSEESSKDSSRANSISVGHINEISSHNQEHVEDEEDTSKEHDYSEDFSDFDNHSVASQISEREPSEDHDLYDTEENDQLSSVVSDDEVVEDEDNRNESIAEEENLSQEDDEDDPKSESESENSQIS